MVNQPIAFANSSAHNIRLKKMIYINAHIVINRNNKNEWNSENSHLNLVL